MGKEIIIPDYKQMYQMTTNNELGWGNCICDPTHEIEYDGETITYADYIVKYLFNDDNRFTITKVPDSNANWGGIINFNGTPIVGIGITNSTLFRTPLYLRVNIPINSYLYNDGTEPNNYIINSSMNNVASMSVKNFDSFCYITFSYIGEQEGPYEPSLARWTNLLLDKNTNEIIFSDWRKSTVVLSTLEDMSNAPTVLNSSSYTNINGIPQFYGKAIRTVSANECIYSKIKNVNGTEATRMYLFTQFPADCKWNTLHIDDKYFLILPYCQGATSGVWGSNGRESFPALGIDITEDIESQEEE